MICFCSSSKVKNSVVDAQSTADACPSQHRRRPGRRRPWSVVVDYWPGIPRLGVGCFGCVVLHPPSVKVPRLPFFMLVGGHADLSGSPRRPEPEGDLRRSGGHPSWMASSSEEDGGGGGSSCSFSVTQHFETTGSYHGGQLLFAVNNATITDISTRKLGPLNAPTYVRQCSRRRNGCTTHVC